MIVRGNFSGDVQECYVMGKTNFINAFKGKVNIDVHELWAEIEKLSKKKK